MTVAKGLRLLKSLVRDFLLRHMILVTCQKAVKLVLNKKNDDAFIEGQVEHV